MDIRSAHKFLILIGLCTFIFIGDMSLKNGLALNLSRIVFSSKRDGNYEIYVMNANGESQIRLTHHPLDDWQPVWSPDGTRIAFISNRNGGNIQIYTMDSNGTNPTRLTDGVWDREPAWSPDGRKIAFAGYPEEFNFEIYVMDADGTNQIKLTDGPLEKRDPDWSPDGGKIAFTVRDRRSRINVMDADGENRVVLENEASRPAWSPDGGEIAFVSGRDGGSEIYVIGADGQGLERLTDDFLGGHSLSFSPTGDGLHPTPRTWNSITSM